MKIEFTATEIAQEICLADRLALANHAQLFNRIKYLAKKGILHPSRTLDARGTLAFATLEVYRATLAVELLGLGMDGAVASRAFRAASFDHPIAGRVAPSRRIDGAVISHGGLRNAITGVAAGEDWNLHIWRQPPGFDRPEELRAAYAWAEVTADEVTAVSEVAAIEGVQPVRSRVAVALRPIFAPLIDRIGLPQ